LNSENQEFKDQNLSITKGDNPSLILNTWEDDERCPPTKASLSELRSIVQSNKSKQRNSTLQQSNETSSTSKAILLALEKGSNLTTVKPRRSSKNAFQSLEASFNEVDTIFEQSFEISSKQNLKSLYRRKSCECSECGGVSKLEKSIQGYPQFSSYLPNRQNTPPSSKPLDEQNDQVKDHSNKKRKLIKLSSFKTPLLTKKKTFKLKNNSPDSSPRFAALNLKSIENRKSLITPQALTSSRKSPLSIEESSNLFAPDSESARETGQIYKILQSKIIEEAAESIKILPKTRRFSKLTKIDLLKSPVNITLETQKLRDSDLTNFNLSPPSSKNSQQLKKRSSDSTSQIKMAYGLHQSPKEPQRKFKVQSFSHFNFLGSQLPKLASPKQESSQTCRVQTSSLETMSPILGPKRASIVRPKLSKLSYKTEGSYPAVSTEELSPLLPGIANSCLSPRLKQDSPYFSASKLKKESKKEFFLKISHHETHNKTK